MLPLWLGVVDADELAPSKPIELTTTQKHSTTRRYGIDLGLPLVLSWLAQKWLQKCHKLAPPRSKNPEQYLTKEQQRACLDSAAAELIREIRQQQPLN
jgi:hypothetical protein